MGMISPQQLYDDPKLWLSVDHQFHSALGKLMEKLFPDWSEKLNAIGCAYCAMVKSLFPAQAEMARRA